jgi:hypothetical protein
VTKSLWALFWGLGLRYGAHSPDSANVHGLWTHSPLQATYYWFASLQSLLQIEQNWVKRLRYHPEKGFFHARDTEGKQYLLLDNQVPSNIPGRTDSLIQALRQFDTTFETRWFCGSFLDSIWSNPLPPGHHVVPVQKALQQTGKLVYPPASDYGDGNANKRQRLGGKKLQAPDFISASPMMEAVLPVSASTKSITLTLVRRISAPITFPRLPNANGTFQTICLSSAFMQPHNCCVLQRCGDKKSNPPVPRLHIDLSIEPWRSKPESYWAPVVAFLQHDQISGHIRPTTAFKGVTPSTPWH